jgi:hypothetical protein
MLKERPQQVTLDDSSMLKTSSNLTQILSALFGHLKIGALTPLHFVFASMKQK